MHGAQIQWNSSNTDILAEDGTVTRPKAGAGNAKVKLTASVNVAGEIAERQWDIVILEEGTDITPTLEPTIVPTGTPTVEPTITPTGTPTVEPTITPTDTPTAEPTATPTDKPTVEPTEIPTSTPTTEPTSIPTITPTPTVAPDNSVPPYLVIETKVKNKKADVVLAISSEKLEEELKDSSKENPYLLKITLPKGAYRTVKEW